MDDEIRSRAQEEAKKHALYNALAHDGDAQVSAIMGPLMGENPAFREFGDEIPGVIAPVIESVNDLDSTQQREQLEALAPELLDELTTDTAEPEQTLPALPNVDDYDQIRMRVAPNPNGPWHIGHARMPAVIGTYKDRYDGWFACRFDDTDPETKRPDLKAYDWIQDDLKYLGFDPDTVVRASDRLDTYYDYATDLIEKGGAYTCSCAQEDFSELKAASTACPHRSKTPADSQAEFTQMVNGEYDPGEMVLRVKTDITHPNPALRDWVAFRVITTPHPRSEAADYQCWPLLDFQSAIDDYLLDITHIIRGIDLQDSAKRQQFIYDDFGWTYPEVIHWGKVQVDDYDIPLSTSRLAELIDAGDLEGWDDPRAPTLRSLHRRGIHGQAIVDAMIELGTSTSNVDLAMSSIYANNRDQIDDTAGRRFLVREAIEERTDGADTEPYECVEKPLIGGPQAGAPPVHPDHEDRGTRRIPVTDAVLVEATDVPPNGERVWLKGLGGVRHTRDAFEYLGDDITLVRDEAVPVIHWVGADVNQPVRLRTMEGDVRGYAEPGLLDDPPDTVIQFERVGFARIDAHDDHSDLSTAYYAHA